jgi:hypothetical protein
MCKTTEKLFQSTGGFVCVRFGGLSLGIVLSLVCFGFFFLMSKNCTKVVLHREGFEVDRLRPH